LRRGTTKWEVQVAFKLIGWSECPRIENKQKGDDDRTEQERPRDSARPLRFEFACPENYFT
jgi:hypothetical protein